MSGTMHFILEIAMFVLACGMILAFIRAVRGPRFTDRIVAINMIGTMTTVMIGILSAYLGETSLVDVSLVYSLLSFLAVVVMCHVVTCIIRVVCCFWQERKRRQRKNVNKRNHCSNLHFYRAVCVPLFDSGDLSL